MQATISARGVNVRPHVKTHKSVRIGRMQIEAGAYGITAASVGEAEVFAGAGFDDILIAFPVWADAPRAARIRALHERTTLSIGVDSEEAASQLAAAVRGAAHPLDVFIELDCGARRSGIPAESAGDLAVACARLGLNVRGVFAYAGHGSRSREARLSASEDEVAAVRIATERIAARGLDIEVLSAGTTPTAGLSARAPVTEVRPGEYVFGDVNNVLLGSCSLDDVALHLAGTVVSTAVPGQVVLDVGSKALGREGSPERGYGWVPGVPGSFLRLLNEHHAFLTVPPEVPRPAVGDVLAIVPNHVCPPVNLFDEYAVVRAGVVVDTWPVDARGHLT
ncbi:amino-acid racemase [Occultella glacieicola]|uniref:Amino-acid racemase n=2 Tax=Occultella glacieicola TaxID=2518684 RepID=A0ABY2DZG5_9MICO|nr:amino-acid racemase [Occultella glacieicola]